jgi:ornithine--oxo-acid transaminase
MNSSEIISLESRHGGNNYAPLPVVLHRGEGIFLWDVEGQRYFDFLSGIGAVSQGHCHPRLVATVIEQTKKLTLVSRAFYGDTFGPFSQKATDFFGYDRILVMNTGVEAVETAIKLCRKWAYQKKNVTPGRAKIVVCHGNFHGRTLAAVSASESAPSDFGPYLPGFVMVPFDDLTCLATALEDPDVAGFLVEPIQGENGVVVPADGYLSQAFLMCRRANVLFLGDEVQTGIARTGRRLACDYENVHPDILILGKALSGGVLPVSAILADNAIMECFKAGDHGSTFGGNPLACAVASVALDIIREEELIENAFRMGNLFRASLRQAELPCLDKIRGKGLLNAIVLKAPYEKAAFEICLHLKEVGLLAKNTRDNIIRFAPPLTITEPQMKEALSLIIYVLQSLDDATK